ncbi:MAG: Na+/H+ antiporter subunit E [Gammaproteobacteria bacterium]|jgi:multicomponent Na+:H+ antiporter subunit E
MDTAANRNDKRQFFSIWMTLVVVWIVANDSVEVEILAVGAAVAALLAALFMPFARVYADIRWTPRVLIYAVAFLGVFLWELVKANLNVARLVFSPRIRIKPGIVEIRTRLKSSMGRLALANAITLTPGTLVVDIKDDALFVHWIVVAEPDPEGATRAIAGRFERFLSVVYG